MIDLQALEIKILKDKENKKILKNALKRCINTDTYISLMDSKSLINFCCDLYKIDQKEFDDIYLKDMISLGHKILDTKEEDIQKFKSEYPFGRRS